MLAQVPPLYPGDDALVDDDISYVDESLRAMEYDSVLTSSCFDVLVADSASLWPETTYPDLYGKTLDQTQIQSTLRVRPIQDFPLSTTRTSPTPAGMFFSRTSHSLPVL